MNSVLTNYKLSPAAAKLLDVLRAHYADCPGRALTDKFIAGASGLTHREIIDLSFELIDAGFISVACDTGRYLVPPTGNLHQAQRYCDDLHSRAAKIHKRAHKLSENIAAARRMQRPADDAGQMNLGLAVGQPAGRFAR